jgi:hypothetical protein
MLTAIGSIIWPKTRACVVIHGKLSEHTVYRLRNLVQSWGVPGLLNGARPDTVNIEIEGRESVLRERVGSLRRDPLLIGTRKVEIQWLPYLGKYRYFTAIF